MCKHRDSFVRTVRAYIFTRAHSNVYTCTHTQTHSHADTFNAHTPLPPPHPPPTHPFAHTLISSPPLPLSPSHRNTHSHTLCHTLTPILLTQTPLSPYSPSQMCCVSVWPPCSKRPPSPPPSPSMTDLWGQERKGASEHP